MRERLQSHLVTLKQGMMRHTATNAEPGGRMSYKMWRDEKRQRETLAEMHMQTPAPSTSRPEDVRGS